MTIKVAFYKGHNSKNPGAAMIEKAATEQPPRFTEDFCENYIITKLLDSNFAAVDILAAARNSYKTATARFVIAEAALCFILHFNPLVGVDPNEFMLLLGKWSSLGRRKLAFSFTDDPQKQVQTVDTEEWCGSILNDISDRVFVIRPFDIASLSETNEEMLYERLDSVVKYIQEKIIAPINDGTVIIDN